MTTPPNIPGPATPSPSHPLTHSVLVAANLVKRYGPHTTLNGVTFSIAQGEIFGLLGRNGAGKTTTIECIIGLRKLDSGSVQIHGIDALADPLGARRFIGAQLQSTALQDKITPSEALQLYASFYDQPADPSALLKKFELEEKADSHFDTLSQGQRQRLAIALALVNNPPLLFLDEPTAGLDAQSRRELHDTIRQSRADGHTILLTTHNIAEAQSLCDRIAILDKGKIVAQGPPAELISRVQATGETHIDILTGRPLSKEWLQSLPGVISAQSHDSAWRIQTKNVPQTLTDLLRRLDEDKNDLLDLHVHRSTLEDVFIESTSHLKSP